MVRERLATIRATTRHDYLLPEIWFGIAQKREKQQWAVEKPKLDNAQKLRGIYFIDLDDGEFKETVENWRFRWGGYALQAEDDQASQQAAGNRQRNQRTQQNPENKACMHRRGS